MIMNRERIMQVQQALLEAELDAIVCRLPENVLFLSGYYSLTGFSFVFFPVNHDPVLIIYEPELPYTSKSWITDIRTFGWALRGDGDPYQSVSRFFTDISRTMGLKTIGYEAGFESAAPPHMSGEPLLPSASTVRMYKKALPDAKWVDATDILYTLRKNKTSYELEMIRLANEVATFGLEAFYQGLIPGKTEAELSAEVEAAIFSRGTGYKKTQSARGWAEVMSGPENSAQAYRMFLISTNRPLEKGDLVLLELGTVADGYWSDLTRTGVVGKPNQQQLDIWQVVMDAQNAAVKKMVAEGEACEVDLAAYSIIEKAGYGKYYPHFTGHGLGFRYHEPYPSLRADNAGELLEVGMVSSIEPGIYIKGVGGIRIEDNIAVYPDGPKYLSIFPKTLEKP